MEGVAILRDRFARALIAGLVVVIGACALAWPVQLDDYDPWGFRIVCGTGLASSYDQASIADEQRRPAPQPQREYVDACGSAIVWRRAWATSMLALGGGVLLALLWSRRATDGTN
jgi:hypothetical protein